MKKSIFRAICLASAGVFLASLVLIMEVLYNYFSQTQEEQLKTQARFAAAAVEREGLPYLEGLPDQATRITWVGADGSVLYDSSSYANEMENHLDREEIKEALRSGYGESARYSTTLMERQIYAAQRLSDGTVIRLSSTHLSVLSLLLVILQPMAVVGMIAAALALILASSLSKRIVKPLNELNLDVPEDNRDYEELRPLLRHIESQQQRLKIQEAELRRKQEEFITATNNLNEGLILLNDRQIILSINRAAARLLSINTLCVGKDILTLNHSLALQELLQKAKEGQHGEIAIEQNGTEYQINASPVVSDSAVTGIALLIFDISEKERAEKMRREFTANVSHELKTPLHAISGYAELLKEGMVKPEDVAGFSGRIYAEAQRLIALVEDIIKLSHLDENSGEMQRETVDLAALAQDTVKSLQPAADKAGISLSCTGEAAFLTGVPHLLQGIVYNLCDNAIKYNRENGSVSVEVRTEGDEIVLTVSDTGIGIPEEHRERVFERFYRVDKSRSKEVGGTGLGLSIVKHAVRLHRGEITLHSVTNGGTTVTVRFPK